MARKEDPMPRARRPFSLVAVHVDVAAAVAALIAAALLVPTDAARAADADDGPSVTVYSTADPAGFDPQQFIAQQRQGWNPTMAWQGPGYGVVKEVRKVSLRAGRNDLRFTDVAQFVDPTTVSIADLTDAAGTAVLEQNFEFDLVSSTKILERYVDQEITVHALKDGVPV